VVQRMAQLAERAGGVIQRVNAFARRRELNLDSVDLTALVRRARVFRAGGARHPRGAGTARAAVWVQGDALLLEHLVHNLCGNALDWAQRAPHAPRSRCGCACQRQRAGHWRWPTAALACPRPNARASSMPSSAPRNGMGMGLAICRSITEAHHGRITVGQDESLGGALFTVQLPLAGQPHQPPPYPTP
jgi:two-component system sensor histidine kinase DctS